MVVGPRAGSLPHSQRSASLRDAERLLELASINHNLVEERLAIALGLVPRHGFWHGG